MKNQTAAKTIAKDLVCGMDVEIASAAQQSEHQGHTYYFCGSKCKEQFDLNPTQYLDKSVGSSKSRCGCCS